MMTQKPVKVSDRQLLAIAIALILIPIGLDALTEFAGINFAQPFYDRWWAVATANGITEQNFATWLRDADSYTEMFAFLDQGAWLPTGIISRSIIKLSFSLIFILFPRIFVIV